MGPFATLKGNNSCQTYNFRIKVVKCENDLFNPVLRGSCVFDLSNITF